VQCVGELNRTHQCDAAFRLKVLLQHRYQVAGIELYLHEYVQDLHIDSVGALYASPRTEIESTAYLYRGGIDRYQARVSVVNKQLGT
jgi:hypothetical protein